MPSASAYPAAGLAGPPAPEALAEKIAAVRADPGSRAYLEALRETRAVQQLLGGNPPFEWAPGRLLADDPAKTLDTTGRTDVLLLHALLETAGRPAGEVVRPRLALLRPRRGGHRICHKAACTPASQAQT